MDGLFDFPPETSREPTSKPPPETSTRLVQVALPVGVDRTFAYGVPSELDAQVRLGVQVDVPFRRRKLRGVVVALDAVRPKGGVRSISAVSDPDVALTPEMLEFTRWLADYYGAVWGEVARTALPTYLGRKARKKKTDVVEVASEVPEPRAVAPDLTAEQTVAVDAIGARLDAAAFAVVALHGVTASGKTEVYMRAAERVLRSDEGQVLMLVPEISISVQLLDAFRARFGDGVSIFHSDLTEARRRDSWQGVRGGSCRILVGARSALFAPFQSLRLVVVDEEHEAAYKQSEQPRYHARDAAVMRARMNDAVCVLGSATPSLETAHNAAKGRYELVRMPSRVDGRRLATVEIADMRVWREERRAEIDARRRERRLVWQRERAQRIMEGRQATIDAPKPSQSEASDASSTETRAPEEVDAVSPALMQALEGAMDRGEQAILLVGRRGHSTFSQCTGCGQAATCRLCDVSLVYHAVDRTLRCHHCGRCERAPERCPDCHGEEFWFGGVGTQRVEAELKRRIPAARVLRMDLDSTRQSGSHRKIVERFAGGDADVLLGTQMVAKGLHFPRVSLVGVVSADVQLNLPDFRAGERTFQLLTQVAGRAGRGDVPGRVVIQTYLPEHPAIQAAEAQDFDLFYEHELGERRELGYPPIGSMARFLIDGPAEDDVLAVADRLAARAFAASRRMTTPAPAPPLVGDGEPEHLPPPALTVIGPAPLPLARLRGRFRWHLTLLGGTRTGLQRLASAFLAEERSAGLPAKIRLYLDMDPIHLL